MEKNIEKSNVWKLVKELEENATDQQRELGEIIATLLVNFSDINAGRLPVLIDKTDRPFVMLIKVLEYYVNVTK